MPRSIHAFSLLLEERPHTFVEYDASVILWSERIVLACSELQFLYVRQLALVSTSNAKCGSGDH